MKKQSKMYTFLYNEKLNFVRITKGSNSIAITAGPLMAKFIKELIEQANKNVQTKLPS
jgi:6-phosphogluconolactonase/glucosamine-6-phosphate isomerase/deaminase